MDTSRSVLNSSTNTVNPADTRDAKETEEINNNTEIKKTVKYSKPTKLTTKQYFLKFLLPILLISLAFLATLISCAILAPQLLIAISIFAIGILGLIAGVPLICKFIEGNECNAGDACLMSGCAGNDGECISLVVGLFLLLFVIGICIACAALVGVIAGLIGGIITSAIFLISENNDKNRFGGLTLPLSLCFMGIFLVPIIICCTNKNIWGNINNFNLNKMMEGVSKENKIIFGTLLAVTFVALIAVLIYLLINQNKIDRENPEKVEITELSVSRTNDDETMKIIDVLNSDQVKNFLTKNQDYKLLDVDHQKSNDSITLVLTFEPRSGPGKEKTVHYKLNG